MPSSNPPDRARSEAPRDFDAVVVGAGFAGLYMLYRLRALGLRVRVFEAGGGVGGTWYWNRYPGARCDVESLEYSYQFSEELQQEWEWTERYAAQPEILRYLEHVAERFDLRRDIQLDTRVLAAHFDDGRNAWQIETERGPVSATYCIMATGPLSCSLTPAIPGRESFRGATYHTGRWPHEGVDFRGLRVGLVGTGSSGVQAIPLIAREAAQLTVFQRTPTYAVPGHNAPLSPEYQRDVKRRYRAFRAIGRQKHLGFGADYPTADDLGSAAEPAERAARYEEYNTSKAGMINLSRTVAIEYGRKHIRSNCICPGVVDTPMGALLLSVVPKPRAAIEAEHAIGQLIRPEEIANVALFLASDESSAVTGAAIVVDGGLISKSPISGFPPYGEWPVGDARHPPLEGSNHPSTHVGYVRRHALMSRADTRSASSRRAPAPSLRRRGRCRMAADRPARGRCT